MLGVPKYKVILENHREEWAAEFEEVKRHLQNIHGNNIIDIQHVGSTAIEGIMAKPMLDIAVLFKCMHNLVFDIMKDNGYIYYGEVAAGKHLFILRGQDDVSLQHIHCYEESNPALFLEQLRFRDFLRTHPLYAREYEQLKLDLYKLYPNNREKYTAGKQAFFDKIKSLAVKEQ